MKFDVKNIKQNIEKIGYANLGYGLSAILLIFMPFFIHVQLLLGTAVNLIFLYLSKDKNYEHRIIYSILPSSFAILNGLLLGPLNFVLLILAPFIWIGNYFFMDYFSKKRIKHAIISKWLLIAVPVFVISLIGVMPGFASAMFMFTQALTMVLAVVLYMVVGKKMKHL